MCVAERRRREILAFCLVRSYSHAMHIRFITTGGTIDKIYFDALSQFEVGESVVEHVLKDGLVEFEYDIVSVFQKDSLEITDQDRRKLYDFISADAANAFRYYARYRHHARDRQRAVGAERKDNSIDGRADAGPISNHGCSIQRRHGCCHGSDCGAGRLHCDERASIPGGWRAQKPYGKPIRRNVGRCAGKFSSNTQCSKIKVNTLCEWQVFTPVNRIRLSSHVCFPRVAARFAAAAGFFFAAKCTANFRAGSADIDIRDAAI